VDGDNIVINNRTDALPWNENLTIAKSLTFVSAVDNIQWWMNGTISITMGENREINLVGLRNTMAGGGITRTGTVPVNRTRVSVVNTDLSGNIDMSSSGINLLVSSSKARDVVMSFGRVFGNDLWSLTVYADPSITEDVIQIVGNRMGESGSSGGNGLLWNSNSQYIFLSNNYIKGGGPSAVAIAALKAGAGTNKIINCTLMDAQGHGSSSSQAGLQIAYSGTAPLYVENCLMGGTASSNYWSNGIYLAGANLPYVIFTYNIYWNTNGVGHIPSAALNNTPNVVASPPNTNTLGAPLVAGTVDTGTPANSDLDLDLTRNNVGCYGGSYSLDNFLPFMSNPQSSRVSFVTTPRVVNQGGTVNVTATGFDK
jgi:hypothetical protein